MAHYKYLIIGGGMAADAATRGIREVDSGSVIGMISAEPDPPYSRPPLTKGLWKGQPVEEIWLPQNDRGVELHLDREVRGIDTAGKQVIEPKYPFADNFHQGMAAVHEDGITGKYGFIDRRGKLVIAAAFDEAGSFAEGLAPVAAGYRRVLIDKTGKVVKQLPPAAPGAEVRIEKIEIDGGGNPQR